MKFRKKFVIEPNGIYYVDFRYRPNDNYNKYKGKVRVRSLAYKKGSKDVSLEDSKSNWWDCELLLNGRTMTITDSSFIGRIK